MIGWFLLISEVRGSNKCKDDGKKHETVEEAENHDKEEHLQWKWKLYSQGNRICRVLLKVNFYL